VPLKIRGAGGAAKLCLVQKDKAAAARIQNESWSHALLLASLMTRDKGLQLPFSTGNAEQIEINFWSDALNSWSFTSPLETLVKPPSA